MGTIILAAGRSSRMGRPKLLLPWGDTLVLGHLIRQWSLAGAQQIVAVHAADDRLMLTELNRLALSSPPVDLVANPNPDRGMFSSIVCAAQYRGWRPSLTHWAIVLGDQPHLRAATLQKLVEYARQHPDQVCQPLFNHARRHPVVLPKTVFLDLATAKTPNLKEFLLPYQTAGCPCDDPGLDLDIDYPDDYQKALALAGL